MRTEIPEFLRLPGDALFTKSKGLLPLFQNILPRVSARRELILPEEVLSQNNGSNPDPAPHLRNSTDPKHDRFLLYEALKDLGKYNHVFILPQRLTLSAVSCAELSR